jgi:tetratricopeptide (TPR) repeat protein
MYDEGMIARHARRIAVAAVSALALLSPRPAAAQSDLERARTYYNEGQFAEAIAAATSAISKPATANSARLIIARARLERFRRMGDTKELATARRELVSLKPAGLAPQEAIEWQIGVGTALFLEDQLGPAAEIFATLLPSARARLSSEEYQKLLDWWGTAVSRLAESLTGDARKHNYERLRADARGELERNPFSRPATYWTVVSARGVGDLDEAWNAAITGWIRMSGQPDGQQLQADLETFVTRTLIPERAQARTGQRPDAKPTMTEISAMNEEWRAVIGRWEGKN